MTDELNPYRAPEDVATPIATGDSAANSFARPFESGRRIGRWAAVFITIYMVVGVAMIYSCFQQIDLLTRMLGEVGIRTSHIESTDPFFNDLRQTTIRRVDFFFSVAALIAFLTWIHRAYRNLPSIGATCLRFSPGWAVAYFFIPILSFFRPYQVVREIWSGSDPAELPESDEAPSPPGIVTWWWTLWIAGGLTSSVWIMYLDRVVNARDLITATWIEIVAEVLSIGAAAFSLFVIGAIDLNQKTKNQLLTARLSSER